MTNTTKIFEDSFAAYAGAVLQSRALVDARDFMKPSARQIMWAGFQNKLIASRPFQKTLKWQGHGMAYYVHG